MSLFRSLLAATLLATLGLTPATEATAQVTLKIATIVPDGTDWMATLRATTDEIERRTEGRVNFKIYGGGVQGNDAQVRRKMRVGQLHGGVFTSGGLRAFLPEAEIYALPMLFRDYDEVSYVRERVDQLLYERLDEAGYVTFGFAGGGFAYLISATPLDTRESMQGVKVWIPEGDKVAVAATETLGVSGVPLPLTDVLTGLQTELIDTVMGPPVGVIVMQWHTVMNYLTDVPLAYVYAGLLIDKRHWNKIAAADQALIRELMTDIYRGFDAQGIADDQASLEALAEEGIETVRVSDTERAAWAQQFAAARSASANAGVVNAELLKTINCHLRAYRQQTSERCSD